MAINGQSQQDAFFDKEPEAVAGVTLCSKRAWWTQGNQHRVQLRWSPADGGSMNILRNGDVRGTTADDGKVKDNLGTHTGTFTYQVCETDSGDCSNEVTVTRPVTGMSLLSGSRPNRLPE